MLERIRQLAEHVATNVSRRQFLGRFGGGALAGATALAGLFSLPGQAQASQVCGANSYFACAGRPVGSPCGTPSRPGRCRRPPDCYCHVGR
jgi:hypothetical protein